MECQGPSIQIQKQANHIRKWRDMQPLTYHSIEALLLNYYTRWLFIWLHFKPIEFGECRGLHFGDLS